MATKKAPKVAVKRFNAEVIRVEVIGDTPLFCDAIRPWTEGEIFKKLVPSATFEVPELTLELLYEHSMYKREDGEYGFPAQAFKSAIVDTALHVNGLHKSKMQCQVHVLGTYVPLKGEPKMFKTIVRNERGQMVPAVWSKFWPWRALLTIKFIPTSAIPLTAEMVMNLLHNAGVLIGIGKGRPATGRASGMFSVGPLVTEIFKTEAAWIKQSGASEKSSE